MPDLIGHLITKQIQRHPLRVSLICFPFPARKSPLILAGDLENTFPAIKSAFFLAAVHKYSPFHGQQPQKRGSIHEISRFHGQYDLPLPNEQPIFNGSQMDVRNADSPLRGN